MAMHVCNAAWSMFLTQQDTKTVSLEQQQAMSFSLTAVLSAYIMHCVAIECSRQQQAGPLCADQQPCSSILQPVVVENINLPHLASLITLMLHHSVHSSS